MECTLGALADNWRLSRRVSGFGGWLRKDSYIYVRGCFCQGGERADVVVIVCGEGKRYVRTHLGMCSLVSIDSNIKYFIFAFINKKPEKIYKIYIFFIFLGAGCHGDRWIATC